MKRVGILAGTFDPVHDGHLAFALQALEACKLDKVFFLVEPRPRRKQGVRALEHRLNMVQLAIANEPKLGKIVLDRHDQFTVEDTLPILKRRFHGAGLYLLMGDDVISHLAGWPHVEELARDVCFVVGVRAHQHHMVAQAIASLKKTRGLELQYILFDSDAPQLSSSNIRLSTKRGHEPRGLPKLVLQYIRRNGLYVSDTNS